MPPRLVPVRPQTMFRLPFGSITHVSNPGIYTCLRGCPSCSQQIRSTRACIVNGRLERPPRRLGQPRTQRQRSPPPRRAVARTTTGAALGRRQRERPPRRARASRGRCDREHRCRIEDAKAVSLDRVVRLVCRDHATSVRDAPGCQVCLARVGAKSQRRHCSQRVQVRIGTWHATRFHLERDLMCGAWTCLRPSADRVGLRYAPAKHAQASTVVQSEVGCNVAWPLGYVTVLFLDRPPFPRLGSGRFSWSKPNKTAWKAGQSPEAGARRWQKKVW